MGVLVDTSIWSLALRRTPTNLAATEQVLVSALRELIRDGHAQLLGPIRQELLSGVRHENTFVRLRDQLRAFDEPVLNQADYEEAAHIHNRCRSRGISGSPADFLICAAAFRRNWKIFTNDHDFTRFSEAVNVTLYQAK